MYDSFNTLHDGEEDDDTSIDTDATPSDIETPPLTFEAGGDRKQSARLLLCLRLLCGLCYKGRDIGGGVYGG